MIQVTKPTNGFIQHATSLVEVRNLPAEAQLRYLREPNQGGPHYSPEVDPFLVAYASAKGKAVQDLIDPTAILLHGTIDHWKARIRADGYAVE